MKRGGEESNQNQRFRVSLTGLSEESAIMGKKEGEETQRREKVVGGIVSENGGR